MVPPVVVGYTHNTKARNLAVEVAVLTVEMDIPEVVHILADDGILCCLVEEIHLFRKSNHRILLVADPEEVEVLAAGQVPYFHRTELHIHEAVEAVGRSTRTSVVADVAGGT